MFFPGDKIEFLSFNTLARKIYIPIPLRFKYIRFADNHSQWLTVMTITVYDISCFPWLCPELSQCRELYIC